MTFAANILARHPNRAEYKFAEFSALRRECEEIAVSIGALNCHEREFCFYDGSALVMRNGTIELA